MRKLYKEFIKEMKQYFEDFDIKNKDELIEYVLVENPKIFSLEFVRERKQLYCNMCGNCCVQQQCPALSNSKKCKHFGTPSRSDACDWFPWVNLDDEGHGLVLATYCDYAKGVAISALNEVFIKFGEK